MASYECIDQGDTFRFPGVSWGYANGDTLAVHARRTIRVRCRQRHVIEVNVVILKVKATGYSSERSLAHSPAALIVGEVEIAGWNRYQRKAWGGLEQCVGELIFKPIMDDLPFRTPTPTDGL